MEIVSLMVFVSLTLVTGAVGLFVWLLKEHTHEHVDRLALLPLDEDPSPLDEDPSPLDEDPSPPHESSKMPRN